MRKRYIKIKGLARLISFAILFNTIISVQAPASFDAINYATSMFKKLDPNQITDAPVGPYDEAGFRPDGRTTTTLLLMRHGHGRTGNVTGTHWNRKRGVHEHTIKFLFYLHVDGKLNNLNLYPGALFLRFLMLKS